MLRIILIAPTTIYTAISDSTVRKLAVRGIRASLGRLLLTMIAIVAGVGFVAGAFILADSLEDTFNSIFENANQGIDAQIVVAELEFGSDVRTIPDTLVAEVTALPEVGEASPTVTIDSNDIFRPFIVLDAEGDTVEPQGPPIITFSWDGEEQEDVIAIGSGSAPVGADQVAIDVDYADAAGVEIGQRIQVLTPDGQKEFLLAGTIELPITAGAYFVVFDFETAQTLYDKEGQVDQIALERAPGVTTDEMIAAVETITPEEAEVLNQAEVIEDQSADFEQVIGIFRNLLLGFAGVALFVSLFIIYNTFAILVSQRLQQIGMLRAVGATRDQIRTLVLFEAVIVGVVGSIIGIGFGVIVAFLIKSGFQAAGGFPETGTIVATRTIIVSLLVGIVATILSALVPASMAGRISPIAAIRNEGPSRSSITRRIVIGAVVLAIGLVLLGFGLFGSGQSTSAVVTELAFGAILTFIGVALLSVLFAGPFVNLIGRSQILGLSLLGLGLALPILIFTVGDGMPDSITGWITFVLKMFVSVVAVVTGASIVIGRLRGSPFGIGGSAAGLEGRLARQNAARSPQRTAATATALTIGIALVSTVGVVGESLKASFADTLDRSVQADLFIFDEETQGSFSGELANRLDGVEGVSGVSRFRINEIRLGPDDVQNMAGFNAETGETIVAFDVSSGDLEGLLDDGVLVFADQAEERGLAVGDPVTVEFPDLESEQLTVSGIFEDNSVLNSPWIIDLEVYERHIDASEDDFVGASIAEGADPEAVKASVVAITEEFSSVVAQDTQEFLATQEGQIDQLITLINYLLGFALVVAFLGVINTIVLSVIERTREIGLLRAVGMTQTQVRSTIRWEAVIVCLFGAVLGIVLGVIFAWAAVSAIPDDIIGRVAIPYESVLFAILAAALAGVVAAVLPARRAAKLDVLEAISTGG